MPDTDGEGEERQDFPIVGIGASAGGIPALRRFFSSAPAKGDMAFVVVMHLAAGRDSVLGDIVGRFSPMPTGSSTARRWSSRATSTSFPPTRR